MRSIQRWGWLLTCCGLAACSSAGSTPGDTGSTGGTGPLAGAGGSPIGSPGGKGGDEPGGEGPGGSDGGSGGSGSGGSDEAGGSDGAAFGGAAGTIQTGGTSPGGNGNAGTAPSCAAVAQKADAKQLPADIIWVVDTSGSMSDETAAVQNRLNAFAQGILGVGIDVRVVMLAQNYECPPFFGCNNPQIPPEGICLPAPLGSGKCPADSKAPTYLHVPITINSTDGLVRIIESYPSWKSMLRPDSVKFIVAVTDDDATFGDYAPTNFPDAEQGAAKKFVADFTALDPSVLTGFKLSGIYCQSNCQPWVASVGKVWDAVVNETKGVKGDLCKQDFQPVFNELAKGVVAAAKLSCSWEIPPPPEGQSFDANLVNVTYTSGSGDTEDFFYASDPAKCDPDQGGWYYDSTTEPKNVIACPSTCTKIQADAKGQIDILFGCATRPIIIN